MQRAIIILIMLAFNTVVVDAQPSDRWFRQKQTQIKYLVEQIAAFKAFGQSVNQGYDIARNGLTNIFGSKEGDYREHYTYFLSLWKVKPDIKSSPEVFSILSIKADIERQYRLIKYSMTDFLNQKERSYVNSVFESLISGCSGLAGELEMVISDGQLQMKDDERIQRIHKIYIEMQDRYRFSRSFTSEIKMLVRNRMKEKNEIHLLDWLHRLK